MLASVLMSLDEKWRDRTVSVIERFPPLHEIEETAWLGSFSWTLPESARRFIVKHAAVTYGVIPMTPTDLSREYLAQKYQGRKQRAMKQQWIEFIQNKQHMPFAAFPHISENAVYIDVQAAYWQIVRAVGWDVDYMPGKWIGVNSSNLDFPFVQVKMARNSLVSMGTAGAVSLWDGKRVRQKHTKSNLVNYGLWRIVCDVLNAVACGAVSCGARYVNTDGYIIDAANAPALIEWLDSWGLAWSVKAAGRAEVRGVGAYSVGDVTTRTFDRQKPYEACEVGDTVNLWLRQKFRAWVDRVGVYQPAVPKRMTW